MNRRLRIVKSILWAFVGVLGVVTVARFLRGLGPTTALSDVTPWGLWIAFDVMAGVALAAGGFVIAATVYIFGLERYRPFVRPAILTAFLGYVAVAVGLLYDLGLPWHIWHPVIYPQHHSVLFEVAMCVMLYLTVLTLEFAPVVLEHRWFRHSLFQAVHGILKRVTIPLVTAGIVLSTLHQSSLGSLFLIAPHRLHSLWYSPLIYVFFFISAVGLGLMVVTLESVLSGWLLGHAVRTDRLAGLGFAAGIVLFIYAVLRLGDLAVRGDLGAAFDGSGLAFLFLFEMLVSAIVPAALLAVRRIRTSLAGMAVCSAMVVFGMVLNRLSVCIFAFNRPGDMPYFPAWTEWAVSLGIVSVGILVFLFFVENLNVYPEADEEGRAGPKTAWRPSYDPATIHSLLPESLAAPRRYSLIAVAAAGIAVAFLPAEAVFGPQPVSTPVSAVRTIEGVEMNPGSGTRVTYVLSLQAEGNSREGKAVPLMMIDGNRDGRLVFFPHKGHVRELGGEDSCTRCHHQNMPFDRNTSCHECHRDMYEPTDLFDHASHIAHLDGNAGCVECHTVSAKMKSRETAKACVECHAGMLAAETFLNGEQQLMTGVAPSYMDAMHGLCIDCHEKKVAEDQETYSPDFARCDHCHGRSNDVDLRRLGPYSPRPSKGAIVSGLAQAAGGASARPTEKSRKRSRRP